MRKWARQGFLNPADSNDDGWYKFSIRPKSETYSGGGSLGFSIQYIISDCSNKIYLEFEPNYVTLRTDGGVNSVVDARRSLKSIATRRKKIRDFAKAVAQSAEKIEQALDEHQANVEYAIEIALDREDD